MVEALAVGGAVLLGVLTQRLSGIGFALVASPLLVLILGPLQGVVITNVFAVLTALMIYVRHVRAVEYRKLLPLLAAACVAAVPSALLARALPGEVLAIAAGTLVLVALSLTAAARRIRAIDGTAGLIAAGALSGSMNVIAGVGGPAIAAYAVASRWPHARFAVSVQFYFAVLGLWSLLVRGVPPALGVSGWVVGALALGIGLVVGARVSRRVPTGVARAACVVIAGLGAVAVIVGGVVGLV